jgi:hypothetical protein
MFYSPPGYRRALSAKRSHQSQHHISTTADLTFSWFLHVMLNNKPFDIVIITTRRNVPTSQITATILQIEHQTIQQITLFADNKAINRSLRLSVLCTHCLFLRPGYRRAFYGTGQPSELRIDTNAALIILISASIRSAQVLFFNVDRPNLASC